MKAVLVQPPIFWTTTPPLGPAYLAGELRAFGTQVVLFDFNIELCTANAHAYSQVDACTRRYGQTSPLRQLPLGEVAAELNRQLPEEWRTLEGLVDDWTHRILREDPDLLGISLHEASLLPALLLARRIRYATDGRHRPRLIAGGPEAVFVHRDPRRLWASVLDALVIGEGEGPLREILARLRSGELRAGEPGFGARPVPGGVIRSPDGELVDAVDASGLVDIDGIALPSFDGLPLERYSFPRMLPILCGRGCPAKCTFCFETVMWRRFRPRAVDAVIAEVKARLAAYGQPLSFRFNDSLLNADLDWLRHFAEALLEEGLAVKWHGNARIHPKMTREYMDTLARAGLTGLLYGVESGSDPILRRMKKGVRAADVPRVLHDTHAAGIWTHAFMILNFPGEGDEEARQTIDLLVDCLENLDSVVFHDFHLPSELVDYVDFPGRVPMERPLALDGPELAYQSNVAAVRPWLDVFMENFLSFAHAHGNIHYIGLPPAQARALLEIHRERWRTSRALARARLAMMAMRELIAEMQRLQLTALLDPDDANLLMLRERRILRLESMNPDEQRLALLVYNSRSAIAAVLDRMTEHWRAGESLPSGRTLLDELAAQIDTRAQLTELTAAPNALVPPGFA